MENLHWDLLERIIEYLPRSDIFALMETSTRMHANIKALYKPRKLRFAGIDQDLLEKLLKQRGKHLYVLDLDLGGSIQHDRRVELINAFCPNLRKLILREAGPKAQDLINNLNTKGIVSLDLINKQSTMSHLNWLRKLLLVFRDVNHLRLVNWAHPLECLPNGRYITIKIRDDVFSKWGIARFLKNNPQIKAFNAPHHFLWNWEEEYTYRSRNLIRLSEISLQQLTIKITHWTNYRDIEEMAKAPMIKWTVIMGNRNKSYYFLNQLRYNQSTKFLDIELASHYIRSCAKILKDVTEIVADNKFLRDVTMTIKNKVVSLRFKESDLDSYVISPMSK